MEHAARGRDINWARACTWLIAGATLLRLVLAAVTPLTPHEAYYWTWSRYPDWSYFDHPPLASYGIWLTTSLLGSTAFGIKSSAVLWSLGWNLLWARLIQDMFGDRRLVFWSLLVLNLTLLYELYGFGPTPDAPMLFGWVGTVWAVWRAQMTGRGRWWFAAGAFLGIACLGKYTGVLLVPVIGLFLLAVPAQRHWLRRPEPWLALAVAAAIFSPVVLWNSQHDWVSLAFQSSRRVGEMERFKPRFFVVLLVTQLLMLAPYAFGTSLAALWRGLRALYGQYAGKAARAGSPALQPRELLLLLSALVPLAIVVAASFRTNAKINWLIPAWWSLVVLGVRHALIAGTQDRGRERRRAWGLAASGLLLAAGIAIPVVPNLPLPGDLNIWSGWQPAARRVDALVAQERAQGRQAFVFAPNHKIGALMWFYREPQERTYAQDIFGRRALQFDYFPRQAQLAGATGFLVVSNQRQSIVNLEQVRRHFDSLELAEVVEVGSGGKSTRRIEIWRGRGYKGYSGFRGAVEDAGADDD